MVRKSLREIVGTVDSNLTFSLLKMMDCFFAPFVPNPNAEPNTPLSPSATRLLLAVPRLLEPWFIFSLVWTMGATCYQVGPGGLIACLTHFFLFFRCFSRTLFAQNNPIHHHYQTGRPR